MIFNPERCKFGVVRTLDSDLNQEFDPNRPMGNYGIFGIEAIVSAWLAGCQEQIKPLLCRANDWIDYGIKTDEQLGPNHNLHRRELRWAKGIGEWLESGDINMGLWGEARIYEEAAWRSEDRPWPRNEIIREGLDDYLAFCYLAGAAEDMETFEAGIDMYEHYLGDKPISLKKTLKPREYGYALCRHYVHGEHDREELHQAGRRMLAANLEENWFGAGQYIRGATWLLIVYSEYDPNLTPLQILLKAYDNMPNVARPPWADAV